MNLQFIQTETCPKCGATASSENVEHDRDYKGRLKVRTHAHGGTWETRRFACGYTVKYIPNFSKEVFEGDCTSSPEYKERLAARADAMDQIKAAIEGSAMDDKFKQEVWGRIEWMKPRKGVDF